MDTVLACAVVLFIASTCYSLKGNSKLPPGPPGLPIIGNMHQIPRNPWKQFKEWHKIYGPIFWLKVGQMTIILIGSHQAAKDILGKRTAIYSSRPRMIVAGECVARDLDTGLMPYGPKWRRFHSFQSSFLNSRKCQLYRPLQDLGSRHLFNLLSSNNFKHEFYRYSSSLMFSLIYGRRLVRGDEVELEQMERLITTIYDKTSLGNWLVDVFPILNYVPRALARWKLLGDHLHPQQAQLFGSNFEKATARASWNWCNEALSSPESSKDVSRDELPFVLGDLYGAGSRTTAGTLEIAVLACVSYPSAMRRAQEELDAKIGRGHLPTFDDVASLPYVGAFVEEVLRWRPLTPAGVAHAST